MKVHIMQWLINAVAIILAVRLIEGIRFSGPWWQMIVIGAIFGLANSLVRPVINFFTWPIILVTLGIFALVINAAMLGLTALVSRPLGLGFEIQGFWPALWGAVIVSIVSAFLAWITGMGRLKKAHKGEKHA